MPNYTGTNVTGSASRREKSSNGMSGRSAICINNAGYPASLKLGKKYRVLRDAEAESEDLIRVVDEFGEDYLYPSYRFRLISPGEAVVVHYGSYGAPACNVSAQSPLLTDEQDAVTCKRCLDLFARAA